MKKVLFRLAIVAFVVGLAYGGYRLFKALPQRQQQVATTVVRQNDVVIRAFSRGELRAVRSATLTAPNLFSTVQVTRLAPLGSLARDKDLIVEFDDSDRKATLEETLLEVDQIDEQIKKAQSDLAIRNNQDQVDLLKTKYAVRRAELEVQRNELLSAIDAKKNLLTLEEQRRRLQQLESDIKSRQEQAQAELAVLREQRNKSMIDVAREKQRISQTKMLSPMTGLVAVRQNRSGMMFFGQQLPDIREGDTVQPGVPIADVLDLSDLEIVAKVGELDRANLHEGQEALIQLDAVAEKQFHGKIKSMSGTASANIFSGDPAKKFDVVFGIDMKELLTGLGAKPEDIKRILATAEHNAKKAPPANPMAMMAFGPGGPAGAMGMGGGPAGAGGGGQAGGGQAAGGMQMRVVGPGGGQGAEGGGMPGAAGGPDAAGGRGGRGGPGGPGGGGFMRMGGGSPEDQKKMRDAMQQAFGGKNPQELSPEERQKGFAKLRELMAAGGGAPGGRPGEGKGESKGEGKKGGGGPGGSAPGGGGRGAGGPGGAGGGIPADIAGMLGGGARSQFSEQDRANAKLPPPPEEDSQLDVLLRPGLLADVEIIVEKIPNALNVPAQAVFEKEGKQIVYVKNGKRFDPRPIQIAKRSESTLVLAGGVKKNEIIALADPTSDGSSKKGAKGAKAEGGGGAGAMSGMPGGGGKGGK